MVGTTNEQTLKQEYPNTDGNTYSYCARHAYCGVAYDFLHIVFGGINVSAIVVAIFGFALNFADIIRSRTLEIFFR